jgi:hypothetical protein
MAIAISLLVAIAILKEQYAIKTVEVKMVRTM